MLKHIRIRNFAIIDHIDIEFSAGMTALTGETGAGKSILLGALGLMLGDRADSDNVRSGSSKSEISAEFDIASLPHIKEWLKEKDLDAENNDCLLRRRLSEDGRSRAFINGTPVPLQDLRELGEMLVDIHGQHEHQSLMRNDMQRQLLDDYANHKNQLAELKSIYQQWKKTSSEFKQLQSDSKDRNDRLDLLRYQVNELNELALQDNEHTSLRNDHQRLANADKLASSCQQALMALYDADDGNIYSQLSQQINVIESASEDDHQLSPANDMLNEARVQIEETASLLRDYLSSLDSDPQRLAEIEQRLDSIHNLSRKHRVEPDQLPDVHTRLQQELSNLDNADENLLTLEKQTQELQQKYLGLADTLSRSRHKVALTLNQKISEAMQTLGMGGGRFEIKVTTDKAGEFAAHGLDVIEFNVAANPGQPAKALAKVASGGELSRISLAIQMITAQQGRIPTLIFDEVDSGVGGGIAEIVGRHLRVLGQSRQVFCVTHLPQVASQAHHHLRVQKHTENNETTTQVIALSEKERVEEISRMLGGLEITKQTRAHAKEMLDKAQA
jgi:DNA repair protein RecN (Recombination protein N)